MRLMNIAAVADIHYPRFFSKFENSLREIEKPDIFLLAGDIVNRGKPEGYSIVVDVIDSNFHNVPIVACFGNEDYNMFHNEQKIVESVGRRVNFLDNKSFSISIKGARIGIIGVSIVSERVKEVSAIRSVFEDQAQWISQSLEELSSVASKLVILSHYSPLAENDVSFSWWFGKAVRNYRPSIIVHGHIHDAIKTKVVVETTSVYNVALPATGSITEINL